jgi:hypothetical protein
MSKFKSYLPFLLLLVLLAIAIFGVSHLFNGLPKGDFLDSYPSPSHKYSINIYLVNGGATVDYAIRGELSYSNIFKKSKSIYWNYHEE